MSKTGSKVIPAMLLALLALTLMAAPAFASGARGSVNPQILGPEDQSKQISVSFWLNQHNKAEFNELVRQMYDKKSPNFHHWIKMDEYKAKFAPTAADLAVVRQHLAAYNLKEVHADQFNHFITARGSVADVQRATGVQLNRVMINGELHRRAESKIAIPGAAAKVVYAVMGLSDTTFKNHVAFRDAINTKPQLLPITHIGPAEKFFNANCLGLTQSETFKTVKTAPAATFNGTRYGNNPNTPPPSFPPCGYNAVQIDKAYGLTSLFKQKLDGHGQTVVIVDAFGSDSITSDANAFAEINGLPALTGSNFSIIEPLGAASCPGGDCDNWNVETSLDVEWSHAVAPGANIALVLSPDNSTFNLLAAVTYAIENNLGASISNSYGFPEVEAEGSDLDVINNAIQVGSAAGISVNFSTGDDGDFSTVIGETSASSPASSPSATGVGGTSLFLHSDHSIKLQTGWGTNATLIGIPGAGPLVPEQFGFQFGAGGGPSYYFAKPTYQSSVPGSVRQVPDIAFLADPFTPAEIVLEDGVGTVGGTSLACPMFSALWVIASQAAGVYPGQASALLYSLPADAITDIPAVTGPDNVTGVLRTPKQPNVTYSADSLAGPLENTTEYVSTLYQQGDGEPAWFVLTFGTDTGLVTGTGWDNVTGLGTPNGLTFVNDVVAAIDLP